MTSNRFCCYVKRSEEALPWLPLVHTCEAYAFRDIIATRLLKAAHCKVLEETLLYFFYGRPAYRTSKDRLSTSQVAFLPISIAVKPSTVTEPARIAPFDTGAFSNALYAAHLHPNMSITDFLLDPTMDMPARLVGTFFGSNEDYLYGRPRHLNVPPLDFEVASYYSLISNHERSESDDRRSSVEVQTSHSVQLSSDQVLLVVLPAIFLDVPEIRETIAAEWRAEIRTYSMIRCNPSEYMGKLYEEVVDYLRTDGYLLPDESARTPNTGA